MLPGFNPEAMTDIELRDQQDRFQKMFAVASSVNSSAVDQVRLMIEALNQEAESRYLIRQNTEWNARFPEKIITDPILAALAKPKPKITTKPKTPHFTRSALSTMREPNPKKDT